MPRGWLLVSVVRRSARGGPRRPGPVETYGRSGRGYPRQGRGVVLSPGMGGGDGRQRGGAGGTGIGWSVWSGSRRSRLPVLCCGGGHRGTTAVTRTSSGFPASRRWGSPGRPLCRWRCVFPALDALPEPVTTKAEARAWASSLVVPEQRGEDGKRSKRGRSADAVNGIWLTAVQTIWAWAVEAGKADASPLEGVRLATRKRPVQRRSKEFTDEEVRTILRATFLAPDSKAALHTARLRRWASWLQAYTGARAGAVIGCTGVCPLRSHRSGMDQPQPYPIHSSWHTASGLVRQVPEVRAGRGYALDLPV
jgi:hypothetical protein